MPLAWEKGLGDDFKAQVGNVTYHINCTLGVHGGAGAFLFVVGARGGKRRLSLGHYKTAERAKQACEQHYANGCNVKGAERWSRY